MLLSLDLQKQSTPSPLLNPSTPTKFANPSKEEERIHQKKKPKPKSKLHAFFSKKIGNDDDDLSVGAVAAMVLEKKKLDSAIENLGIRIDNKFGPGTWDEILATRDKMLEDRAAKQRDDKKAAAAQAHKEDKFWDTILYWVVEASKLGAVLVVAGGIIYWVWSSRCTEGTC